MSIIERTNDVLVYSHKSFPFDKGLLRTTQTLKREDDVSFYPLKVQPENLKRSTNFYISGPQMQIESLFRIDSLNVFVEFSLKDPLFYEFLMGLDNFLVSSLVKTASLAATSSRKKKSLQYFTHHHKSLINPSPSMHPYLPTFRARLRIDENQGDVITGFFDEDDSIVDITPDNLEENITKGTQAIPVFLIPGIMCSQYSSQAELILYQLKYKTPIVKKNKFVLPQSAILDDEDTDDENDFVPDPTDTDEP